MPAGELGFVAVGFEGRGQGDRPVVELPVFLGLREEVFFARGPEGRAVEE